MSDISIDIFHQLFFNSDIQANLTNSSTNDNNLIKSSTIQSIKTKLLRQLGDWFSFIETKSQGNITISLFVLNNFFFIFFDRVFFNI